VGTRRPSALEGFVISGSIHATVLTAAQLGMESDCDQSLVLHVYANSHTLNTNASLALAFNRLVCLPFRKTDTGDLYPDCRP
jgi:hypothetical protein